MIQISIITVGMNHLSYLKSMLASIYGENQPKTPFEMIYVDNCSTDGSVEYIKANYPQVKVIVNTEPLGFGENNNKGVFASTGKYIAIINPDIVMHPGSLDKLFDFAESHPDVGIVVPKLLNPDGSLQYSVRGFISLSILLARIRTKGKDNVDDKEVDKYLCRNLEVKAFIVTKIEDGRAVEAEELFRLFQKYTDKKVICRPRIADALREAEKLRKVDGNECPGQEAEDPEGDIYCLGSLYLAGMVKKLLSGGGLDVEF